MKSTKLNARSSSLIQKIGHFKHFEPGQTIYFQQEQGNTFFYIVKGRVRAYLLDINGKEFTYEIITEGRLFGTTDPFVSSHRTTTIESINEVDLIELDLDTILPYLHEVPELAIEIIGILSHSLEALARHIRRLSFYDAKGRIADFLLERTDNPDLSSQITSTCVPYSHQEIADCCALQRVTVTNALHELADLGLIALSYRKVFIKDRKGFAAIVNE